MAEPRPHYDLLRRYAMSLEKLRDAAQSDPGVREEAQAELNSLRGIHEERCVMTKEYRDALQRALA